MGRFFVGEKLYLYAAINRKNAASRTIFPFSEAPQILKKPIDQILLLAVEHVSALQVISLRDCVRLKTG